MATLTAPVGPQVALSDEARQVFERVFKPTVAALHEAARKVALVVLVWGPGASGGDLYHKRVQIRDELRRRGHAAFFSEELGDLATDSDTVLSTKGQEFLQAQAADYVIVLAASYGSVAEVHDFASFLPLLYKMFVFVNEAAQDGYSFQGALTEMRTLYGNVQTYRYPDDITACHLLAAVIEKTDALRMLKYRAQQQPASWGAG